MAHDLQDGFAMLHRNAASVFVLCAVACGGVAQTNEARSSGGAVSTGGRSAASGGAGGSPGSHTGTSGGSAGASTGGAGASTGGAGASTGGVGASTGGAGASTGGAGASTGGTGGGGPVAEPFWSDLPIAEFKAPMCSGEKWLGVQGLNPAMPVDYVALELKSSFADPDAGAMPPLDSSGTECATATDKDKCQNLVRHSAALVALKESCGGPPYPCQHYLVTTEGDTVRTYTPGNEYLSFLGTIDTPAEALLVVGQNTFFGYEVMCNDRTLGSVRSVADGYEVVVLVLVKDCAPIEMDRVLLHVGKDGSVTELRRNVASVSSACI